MALILPASHAALHFRMQRCSLALPMLYAFSALVVVSQAVDMLKSLPPSRLIQDVLFFAQ